MTEAAQKEIDQFLKERDEAFLSLDEQKIRAMYRKFVTGELPQNPLVFWAAVHKAITGTGIRLPIEFRRKSKLWLDEHGFRSWDDGDL